MITAFSLFLGACAGGEPAEPELIKSEQLSTVTPSTLQYNATGLRNMLPDAIGEWQGGVVDAKEFKKDGKSVARAGRLYTKAGAKAAVELMDASESPTLLTPFVSDTGMGSGAMREVTVAGKPAKVMHQSGMQAGAFMQVRDGRFLLRVTAQGIASEEELLLLGTTIAQNLQ